MFRAILIILTVICCSFFIPQDNNTDKLVMKAAEGQLEAYLGKIKPGNYAAFGFKEGDDLENCNIAKPYRLITFTNDFYKQELTDNVNYIDIKQEWLVPVTVKGEHRVLFTVNGTSGNFTVSGMGSAELAKELEIKSAPFSDNDAYFLLRIPPLSVDFFVADHENSFDNAEFIPLESAKKAIPSLRTSSKQSFSLDEVQKMVKTATSQKPGNKAPAKKKSANKKHSQ